MNPKVTPTSPARPKILVIVGPTASGKSGLAVDVAVELQKSGGKSRQGVLCEIISADSRQVYTGLDIGTGKITTEEMQGIPHHLLDIADPTISADANGHFSVNEWKSQAEKVVDDITSRGKIPIICGGTGFYIEALVDGLSLPEVPPDQKLRDELALKTSAELMGVLEKLDPDRALDIDPQNSRRIIRAIEIATTLGKVPKQNSPDENRNSAEKWDVLKIGITTPDEKLRQNIHTRLLSRINAGMIEEAEHLHAAPPVGINLSYERMNELGLEYRYLAEFLQSGRSESAREKFIETLSTKIWQYARRQKTWFKRDKKIEWFSLAETDKIIRVVKNSIT